MIELFDAINSYINKIIAYFTVLFDSVKDSITELKVWFDFLPPSLVAAAALIVVLLVVFRILGR